MQRGDPLALLPASLVGANDRMALAQLMTFLAARSADARRSSGPSVVDALAAEQAGVPISRPSSTRHPARCLSLPA
jgi:hypothetical protein